MKNSKLILLLIIIILLMSRSETGESDIITANTTLPRVKHNAYEIPLELRKENYSVEEFNTVLAEFLKLNNLKLHTSLEEDRTGLSKEEQLKYYTIYDITPKSVKEEIGCQLFKVNYTCETYVVYNSKIYSIGRGFGGYGLVSIETCDFDDNGKKDLLYTFSSGSGIHSSQIGVFNFTNEHEEWLDFQQLDKDIMLEKVSDKSFKIFTAKLTTNKLDYTHLTLSKKDNIAEVKTNNGKIRLIKYRN